MSPHLIRRVAILGTGLIGGSFALALKKYLTDIFIHGWDRPGVAGEAHGRRITDQSSSGSLQIALEGADLVYIALPIAATLDILPEVERFAAPHALVTDACSTKLRITQDAAVLFSERQGPRFLGGHPMAGKEHSGISAADADLFRDHPYALITEPSSDAALISATGEAAAVADLTAAGSTLPAPPKLPDEPPGPRLAKDSDPQSDPRVAAFVKIVEKIGAKPMWIGAQQHDYAVGLASHLPQLAAVALASFLYDRLDENGLPITLAGPGLRDSLRLAGSPYSTWRDIILTNREILSASLDLFARRIDELRERLASRDLETDFDAANELYKLLRGI
jgi:prephenate dehydrogenase